MLLTLIWVLYSFSIEKEGNWSKERVKRTAITQHRGTYT